MSTERQELHQDQTKLGRKPDFMKKVEAKFLKDTVIALKKNEQLRNSNRLDPFWKPLAA